MSPSVVRSISFDKDYYSLVYRDYCKQTPPGKLSFYQGLLDEAFGVRRTGTRLLDIGCAFGDFLQQAPTRWERFGADVNEFAVQEARKRSSNVTFFVSPFPPESAGVFDAITAFDVLEHITDIEAIGELIRSRLAPRGLFLFVVPVYDGPLGWVVNALDKDPTHLHKMHRDYWLDFARRRFNVIKWTGIVRWMPPIGSYIHVPTQHLRTISPGIAVLCRDRSETAPTIDRPA